VQTANNVIFSCVSSKREFGGILIEENDFRVRARALSTKKNQ